MKKKILSLGIVAVLIIMLVVLTGCGENTTQNNGEQGTAEEVTEVGKLDLEVQGIWDFSEGLAKVKINDKYGFINTKGEIVIEAKYESASDFSEGLAVVGIPDTEKESTQYYKPEKYGYIDKDGNVVIEPQYEGCSDFKDGKATVKKGIKGAFIDKTGKELTDFKYTHGTGSDGVPLLLGDGLAVVSAIDVGIKTGFFAIIDTNNNYEPIVNQTFGSVEELSSGLIAVKQAESMNKGKYGYIDSKGNLVIDYQYDTAWTFINEMAMVEKDGKVGLINSKGEVIVDFKYPDSNSMMTTDFSKDNNGMISLYDGEQYIYFDKDGNEKIKLEKGISASDFAEGYAKVKKDDKYGYIDTNGKLVIDYQYKSALDFSDGLAYVTKDSDSFEFINNKGKTIIAGKIVKEKE